MGKTMRLHKQISVILTNKCTANCDICCYSCSTKENEKLSFSEIENILNTVTQNNSISHLNISGGEPFLYLDDLYKIVEMAHKMKLTISCVTNGFWCNDHDKTYEVIHMLKQLGLDVLYTSYDMYHSKYVTADKLKLLFDVCKECHLDVQLNLMQLEQYSTFTSELFHQLGYSLYGIKIHYIPICNAGAAKDNIEPDAFHKKNVNELQCVFTNTMNVMSNGNVYPCCARG